MNNLPSEIHKTIRTYGYTPYVSNEDLYKMILDLGFNYSLMSIYDRLVQWDSTLVHNKIGRYQFDAYRTGVELDNIHEYLTSYITTLQSNPVNSTEVFVNHENLEYNHYSIKSRPTIYDYSDELVELIKEVYPSFSLQNDYTNLSLRKKYANALDEKYANLLIQQDKELFRLTFNTETNTLTMLLEDYLGEVPDFIEDEEEEYSHEFKELTEYTFKEGSLELFYQMIAFISPRLLIQDDIYDIHRTHRLPYQSEVDY